MDEMLRNDDVTTNNNGDKDQNNIKCEYIKIYVGGLTYYLDVDDVRKAPSSRLYRYVFARKMTSIRFNRPIQSFEAILAFYQTGELHMPLSFCPGAFKTELDFWGLDAQIMSKCCYYRYMICYFEFIPKIGNTFFNCPDLLR